jgi:hypothetical protein
VRASSSRHACATRVCSIACVDKFLKFLEFRQAWQLTDLGVTAAELLDVYARVKRNGRDGVEHSAWMKGVKFVSSLTPHEVTDFQQFWLSPDDDVRAMVFHDAAGRRKR